MDVDVSERNTKAGGSKLKLLEAHKKRAERMRQFMSANKLFALIAMVMIILIVSGVIHSNQPDEQQPSETETQTEKTETELPAWRFYPVDLGILLIGGGICTVMIIRERRKAKEEMD